ncbi:MAG: toxin-antitoxin system HicB family antitoxin [Deltaproteobacteria bacterium]|nr:toxin-antitoxin system HicB family antitoxin [Deltaproteobacteria bacterium]
MSDKDLNYYLSLNYPMNLIWDADDKVYFVEFPDLSGCMVHGTTPTSAVKLAQEVKKEWLVEALTSGISINEPKTDDDYSGKFVARLTPALHKRLAEQAAVEGRSLNAHVATLLSERSAALTVETVATEMEDKMKRLETAIVGMEAAHGRAAQVANVVANAASSPPCKILNWPVGSHAETKQSDYTAKH